MKTLRAVVAVGAVLSLAVILAPTRASDELVQVASLELPAEAALPYWPDEVVVEFHDGADDAMVERAVRVTGGERARRSAYGRRYLVKLTDGLSVPDAVRRLRSFPEVEYAEPNGMVRAFQRAGHFTPNDRLFSSQWHLRLLNAERIWGIQQGDSSVVIAVLDSGVAYEDFGPFRKAPDFGSTVFVGSYNAITRDTHANDDNFHGTHVASIIGESTNNSTGVAGLAFNCAIMPVKVLDRRGLGSFFQVAEGMDHAVNFTQGGQHPVKVINLSLGGESSSETMTQAVNRAVAAGITVVAAAGNESSSTISFPASLSNVIAVGALDGRKSKAPYSNTGSALDVMAFGGDINRDDVGSDSGGPDGFADGILQQTFNPTIAATTGRYDAFAYFYVVGTSQATPQVAALAGLLYRQGITDPAAIQSAIEQTAEDLGTAGRDDTFGHGLIRPHLALSGLGDHPLSGPADLLKRLPDVPRHVEARGLLLSGRCEVLAEGDGALVCARQTPLVCVVGRPGPRAFARVMAGAGEHEFLVPADGRAFVEKALAQWEAEEAAVHVLPEDAPLPRPMDGVAVGCLEQGAQGSLPAVPEDLSHELRTALEHGPVVVAFAGREPASFAYAPWETEGWFDLSVDTLQPYRRRGLAEAAARELMMLQGAAGRRPVWGAVASNLASRRLAEKLGFRQVDRLVMFTRRRGETASGPHAAL